MVHVSKGNTKLGRNVWNVNLPPGITCGSVPCLTACYAMKAWRLYPHSRKAWTENLNFFQSDPKGYFEAISLKLRQAAKKPSLFRWHVAGDIPSQEYLEGMKQVAREHGDIRFMAFTKNFKLGFSDIPANLSIVLSMWPGVPVPDSPLPKAWMQDGTEDRIPKGTLECRGHCEICGMCWALRKLGKDVVFHKH